MEQWVNVDKGIGSISDSSLSHVGKRSWHRKQGFKENKIKKIVSEKKQEEIIHQRETVIPKVTPRSVWKRIAILG